MAKKRKGDNETQEETEIRHILEAVANAASRSEKTSWNRKMDNMVRLLAELRPIEDQILELMAKKWEVFDRVQQLREVMVRECVHPYEHLVYKEDYIECKFCNKRISIPHGKSSA